MSIGIAVLVFDVVFNQKDVVAILGISFHLTAQRLDGKVVYWRRAPDSEQVLGETLVKTVNCMLREVLRSGPSNDFRDAWIVGYTADLVCAIWLGNDNNRPMPGLPC